MITYVTSYYNEPEHLKYLLDNINLETFSKIIIVDDGSQIHPAYSVASQYSDLPLSLYRVKEDIGFNSHGCRNLAMKHVDTDWALLTDIDIHFGEGVCYDLRKRIDNAQRGMFFNFYRSRKEDWIGRASEAHNDFCIHVDDYQESGGYDEEFTPWHYGDRLFCDRLRSFLTKCTMPNIIIDRRLGREIQELTSVDIPVYDEENRIIWHPKMPLDKMKYLTELVGQRNENRNLWKRDTVNFEWEKLL